MSRQYAISGKANDLVIVLFHRKSLFSIVPSLLILLLLLLKDTRDTVFGTCITQHVNIFIVMCHTRELGDSSVTLFIQFFGHRWNGRTLQYK